MGSLQKQKSNSASRKRKLNPDESDPLPPEAQALCEEKKPRQTGSMVAHHDDIVTRMKNVELIELGRYRIRPWYFAPYPQVG